MEDRKIVDLYFRRDQQAVAETADKYGRLLAKIAYGILNSSHDAEECVNDTYLKLWEAIPPDDPDDLCSFAARIVRNLAINMLSKKNTLKRGQGQLYAVLEELAECIPSENSIEESIDEKELTGLINRFLEGLPKKARIIFVRKYWWLDSIRSIAADLNMSENSVRAMLFRTKVKLKKLLEKEGINL